MSAKSAAPVIIRRKKTTLTGGHHGGAWKVAYADFVTAMMAFFLLMWLLNATTEKQRKGLADYFNPTIAVNRVSGGGEGALHGDSTFAKDQLARSDTGGSPGEADSDPSTFPAELEELERIARMLDAQSGTSMIADRLLRHIGTRMTDEGLVIELFDLPDALLFIADSTEPTVLLREMAEALARVLASGRQPLAVSGHVRSYSVVRAEQPAWPLSYARASILRELLGQAGISDRRFLRVTGQADRAPAAMIRSALRNNRLELILLKRGRDWEDTDKSNGLGGH